MRPRVPRRSRRRERELAQEGRYACGECGEEIVVPIDVSAGAEQSYVEDCPVCCRPHRIHVELDADGSARVWAEPE
ncbi:MAG: CPXCG motif-containing cysteine-rich protein [Planctomycetes bacterium]|nr:CPXCG motif-containing cysteine-rich protein [Planctomycetota bacterium]